ALPTTRRASLNLTCGRCDCEIGNKIIRSLARAMTDDRAVAPARASVIAANDCLIGHKDVVADNLDAAAQTLGEELPSFPVSLGESVFDGHDRELAHPLLVERDHFCGR